MLLFYNILWREKDHLKKKIYYLPYLIQEEMF